MRVIHAPFNTGNQSAVLSMAEKRRMAAKETKIAESVSVNFAPSYSCYPTDKTYSTLMFFQRSVLGKILNSLKIFLFGLLVTRKYDVFNFYFGRSFLSFGIRFSALNMLDIWFLRKLGKRVFLTYQGCDARQRTAYWRKPISACKETECFNEWCNARIDRHRQRNIARTVRYCDKVFCLNPDLVPLVKGSEFLPYATLFFEDIDKVPTDEIKRGAGPVKILHTPTDRWIKGTKYVEHAIRVLSEKYDIEFILIENKSQEQVYQAYKEADILVDQLLTGWYGSTSVEGMAVGLPVVTFINQGFLQYLPEKMAEELPIVSADPLNIRIRLEELIVDARKRSEIGQRGREFVRRWHDPVKIAKALEILYIDPTKSFAEVYEP